MIGLVSEVFYKINSYLQIFLPPVAFLPGLFGNFCCLLVFILSPLRTLKSTPYLIGLSIVHFGALTCLVLVWLERFDVHVVEKPGWCQAIDFLHCVCNHLSIVFVFCFTWERYLSFCCRPGGRFRCVAQRAPLVTALVVVLALMYYSVLFWSRVTKGNNGGRYQCKYRVYVRLPPNIFTKYLLSLAVVMEACLVIVTIVLDIVIMVRFAKKVRAKREAAAAEVRLNGTASRSVHSVVSGSDDNLSIGTADDIMVGSDVTTPRSPNSTLPRPLRVIRTRQLRRSRSLLSIRSKINATRMLFAASSTFLIMQSPFIGFQVYAAFEFFLWPYGYMGPSGVGFDIAVALYFISFALSFFVYMIFGKNFRDAVLMLVTCQYGKICARYRHRDGRDHRKRQRQDTLDGAVVPTESNCATLNEPDKSSGKSIEDEVSRYIDDTSPSKEQTAPKAQPVSSRAHVKNKGYRNESYI